MLNDKTFTFDFDDAFAVWQNNYNKDTHICEMNITGFVKTGKSLYKRFDETHFQYCFDLKTVEQTLEEAGFYIENMYSAYDERLFEENDERVLIEARKK